jgi:hypothetical protein
MKLPITVGAISAVSTITVVMLWLKFPSLVPIGVLMIVGILGAVTFLVSELIVIVRIVRMFSLHGQFAATLHNLPPRTFLGLVGLLLLCNASVFYLFRPRPSFGYFLAANVFVIVSWAAGLLAVRRYIEKSTPRDTP